MSKKIVPAALLALKQALTDVYWYKSDLRSFLTATLSKAELVAQLNWDDYKRNIVAIADLPDISKRRKEICCGSTMLGTNLGAWLKPILALKRFS